MPIWLVVVAAMVSAAAAVVAYRRRIRPRVVVVLDTGRTIEGVLLARYPTRVKLGDAGVLIGGTRTPVDGFMFVERSRVEWIQQAVA